MVPDASNNPFRLNLWPTPRSRRRRPVLPSPNLAAYSGLIIEFVEHWRELDDTAQTNLLVHPWDFKRFVIGLDYQSTVIRRLKSGPTAQQYPLFHLVFPDTFEPIVSVAHRANITSASTLANYIIEPTDDEDRKLAQIRQHLEARLSKDFSFYDPSIQKHWDPSFDPDNKYEASELPEVLILQPLAAELNFGDESLLQTIELLLEDKHQVIFQGPPGTGKTYVAQKLAKHLSRLRRSGYACSVPPVILIRGLCAGLPSHALEERPTRFRVDETGRF